MPDDQTADRIVAFLRAEGAAVHPHAGGRSLLQHLVETAEIVRRWDQPPILQHAVILDVAAARNVDCLDPGEEIAVSDLERALTLTGGDIRAGDAVLIRTGWSKS